MDSKAEVAENLFCAGANCAQAVFGAFAGECGFTQEEAFRISSGFGGGRSSGFGGGSGGGGRSSGGGAGRGRH